jgi:hypothetical protein
MPFSSTAFLVRCFGAVPVVAGNVRSVVPELVTFWTSELSAPSFSVRASFQVLNGASYILALNHHCIFLLNPSLKRLV